MGHDVFLSFIELSLEGSWDEITSSGELELKDVVNGRAFVAMGESSISVVEPEAAIRRFSFKQSALIIVGNSVVSFDRREMENEFSVDEEARMSGGRRLKFDT